MIRSHITCESYRWKLKVGERCSMVAVVDLALWSILSLAMMVKMFFSKFHETKTPSLLY